MAHGASHARREAPPRHGERNGRAKLSDAIVAQIRALVARGGVSLRQLGEDLGVHHVTVSRAARAVTWAHVEGGV